VSEQFVVIEMRDQRVLGAHGPYDEKSSIGVAITLAEGSFSIEEAMEILRVQDVLEEGDWAVHLARLQPKGDG
jgi:hypothetical protein